jgi:hypothetical protein
VSPNSTVGSPSGANSVRVGRSPPVTGKLSRTKPGPVVYLAAALSHCFPTPNHKPSSSLVGGAQTPPICPVVCQPIGGNVPFSAPTT